MKDKSKKGDKLPQSIPPNVVPPVRPSVPQKAKPKKKGSSDKLVVSNGPSSSENKHTEIQPIKETENLSDLDAIPTKNNLLYKVLSGVGLLLLGGIVLLLPNIIMEKEKTDKELTKILDASELQNQKSTNKNLSKTISSIIAPAFEENWGMVRAQVDSPPTQTPQKKPRRKPTIFTPIVIDEKGGKLEFTKYSKFNGRIKNTLKAKNLVNKEEISSLNPPPLNTLNLYFSNQKNLQDQAPLIGKTEEGKLLVTINDNKSQSNTPPEQNTSRIDKLFPLNSQIKGKNIEVSVMVKFDKIHGVEPTNKEVNWDEAKVQLRTISQNSINNWLDITNKIPIGQWTRISKKLNFPPSIEFLNLRAESSENYQIQIIPEIKVTLQKD
jgi:hypothetical protein